MLKKALGLFLILTVLMSNFTQLLIYAGFEMNRSYIAAKFCENKDRPWMNCNGKCYLSKKIKQAEEKEKSQERQDQKSRVQEAFITQKITVKFPVRLLQIISAKDLPFNLPQHSAAVFHPPKETGSALTA